MKDIPKAALVIAISSVAFCAKQTSGATCGIRVEKGSASIDDGTTIASFLIKPYGCKSCEGVVKFKIYYKGTNSQDNYYVGGKLWASPDGTNVDAVAEGYEPYCKNKTFGPCQVKAWEITEKTCYEK